MHSNSKPSYTSRLYFLWNVISEVFLLRVNYKKAYFMYVTYCKLCPLSSIIKENVLDVCKPLQVMSFSPNSVNFCG
ncbi:hypothetical protein Hanom_Chr03g00250841 [Helianthus anomalus]